MLAAGKTPYGKRHTSRTISATPLQSIVEAISAAPLQSIVEESLLTDQFDTFINPKNASETNARNNASPT